MNKNLFVLAVSVVTVTALSLAPSVSAASTNYAFGDSRASGLGLAALPGATQEDTACGRSSQSYSAIAAAQSGVINKNFACSGATLYGVNDQIGQAISYGGKPNYVTLTDGANDVSWSQWINDCMAQADCGGPAPETAFQNALVTYKSNLAQILAKINTNLAPGQILVAGYGPLFGSDPSCAAAYGITAAEAATIDRRIATLDGAMSSVVSSVANATFVPISFGGQGICTPDGPIQPPSSPTYAHPTVKGAQIIANAVLAKAR